MGARNEATEVSSCSVVCSLDGMRWAWAFSRKLQLFACFGGRTFRVSSVPVLACLRPLFRLPLSVSPAPSLSLPSSSRYYSICALTLARRGRRANPSIQLMPHPYIARFTIVSSDANFACSAEPNPPHDRRSDRGGQGRPHAGFRGGGPQDPLQAEGTVGTGRGACARIPGMDLI